MVEKQIIRGYEQMKTKNKNNDQVCCAKRLCRDLLGSNIIIEVFSSIIALISIVGSDKSILCDERP